MTAFILTWKDTVWPYERLHKLIEAFQRDGHVDSLWRIAAHKAAAPGDLAFLLKQGKEPRGVFGFGRLLDGQFRGLIRMLPKSRPYKRKCALRCCPILWPNHF